MKRGRQRWGRRRYTIHEGQVKADYKHGVPRVHLRKATQSNGRKIRIE